jgi:glycosyltransferase involved in cell wall biosynthesis
MSLNKPILKPSPTPLDECRSIYLTKSRLPVLEEIRGDTGYFVEPGASDSLAKAILNLADDPGLRTAIGLQGRKKAEDIYSWDAIVERMVSLYKYLTDHRSR